jgi:hypothetical protein
MVSVTMTVKELSTLLQLTETSLALGWQQDRHNVRLSVRKTTPQGPGGSVRKHVAFATTNALIPMRIRSLMTTEDSENACGYRAETTSKIYFVNQGRTPTRHVERHAIHAMVDYTMELQLPLLHLHLNQHLPQWQMYTTWRLCVTIVETAPFTSRVLPDTSLVFGWLLALHINRFSAKKVILRGPETCALRLVENVGMSV